MTYHQSLVRRPVLFGQRNFQHPKMSLPHHLDSNILLRLYRERAPSKVIYEGSSTVVYTILNLYLVMERTKVKVSLTINGLGANRQMRISKPTSGVYS